MGGKRKEERTIVCVYSVLSIILGTGSITISPVASKKSKSFPVL